MEHQVTFVPLQLIVLLTHVKLEAVTRCTLLGPDKQQAAAVRHVQDASIDELCCLFLTYAEEF